MTVSTRTTVADLKKTLARLAPAIPSRSTINALQHVRIADGRIESTDMTAHVSTPCAAAEGISPTLVSFADLKRVVGALKVADEVGFVQDDAGLRIVTPRGEVAFRDSCDLDDFPLAPTTAFPFGFEPADVDAFSRVLLEVSSVYSRDESRPVLQSTCIDSDGSHASLTCTDSYRLAMDSEPVSGDAFRVLVPTASVYLPKTARIICVESSHESADAAEAEARAAKAADGDETAYRRDPKQWVRLVDADGTITTMRATIGKYPNHEQLVPKTWQDVAEVPDDLLDAVKFAKKACGLNNEPLRLAFDLDGFDLSAAKQDGASSSKRFDVPGIVGDHLTIGFNADFLADGLALMGACTISLISPLRPGLLASKDRPSRSYLLMPVRLPA